MADKAENSKNPETQQEQDLSAGKSIQVNAAEYQKLSEELAKFKEEAVQCKDRYVRLYAEFDNARKRMEREKQEFIKFANEGLICEFLSILDDLDRSVESAKAKHEDYAAFLKGIEMVMAHIYEMLKENGVKPMEAKGKIFDPHCHEVLMQEETDQHEDGVILDELQKGYYLGDRVVRTAKVKVAKKKNRNL